MLTCTKLVVGGRGLAPVLLRRAAIVLLDWDVRQKSRFDAIADDGRRLGVFLPRGTSVRGGDVLVGEDGSLTKVQSAPQPVQVVTICPDHGSAFDLLRAAYHLGNRHVALELRPDRLVFEPDPVLADMLRRMHLLVADANEPFEPESGAYAVGAHDHEHATHGPHAGHGVGDRDHSHEHHAHTAHR